MHQCISFAVGFIVAYVFMQLTPESWPKWLEVLGLLLIASIALALHFWFKLKQKGTE